MYVDISHKPEEFITTHFPMIHTRLMVEYVDMTKSRSLSYRLRTTLVVALWLTNKVKPISQQRRLVKSATDTMVRTIWLRTHYLSVWCMLGQRQKILLKTSTNLNCGTELPAWDESQVTNSDEEVIIQHNWLNCILFLNRITWGIVHAINA